MDAPLPQKPDASSTPAPAAPSGLGRTAQFALATLLGSALVWLVTQSALQGSIFRGRPTFEPTTTRLDLNAATRAELRLLPGVGENLAERIHAYRILYGSFNSVDELRKVPGIGPMILERLRPHVTVTGATPIRERPPEDTPRQTSPKRESAVSVDNIGAAIDINTASAPELERLPGIGRKLAQRIVDTRAKVAFASIDELRRVPGIGPKTLEKVRPHVVVK